MINYDKYFINVEIMKIILLLLSVITLTACASPSSREQTAWLSPEMQQAKAKCHYEVNLAKIKKSEQAAMLNACMMAQGYQ
jgi:negative regulator of sigma E activity